MNVGAKMEAITMMKAMKPAKWKTMKMRQINKRQVRTHMRVTLMKIDKVVHIVLIQPSVRLPKDNCKIA